MIQAAQIFNKNFDFGVDLFEMINKKIQKKELIKFHTPKKILLIIYQNTPNKLFKGYTNQTINKIKK